MSVLTLQAIGCGKKDSLDGACPTHGDPTFQIGTGDDRFVPIVEGSDLRMTRGLQGGCHFMLAFLTDGFEGSETLVLYRLDNLDDGQQIISSQQFVRLRPEENGRCLTTNFVAFLVAPWNAEDDRVRIDVTLEDEAGSNTQRVEVVARWPEPVAGIERDQLCGAR